jgi:hypothetical protein
MINIANYITSGEQHLTFFFKSTDLWEIFLPLIIFLCCIHAAIFFERNPINTKLSLLCIMSALIALLRILYVVNILPYLWWQYISFAGIIVLTLSTIFVKYSNKEQSESN